MGKKYKTEEWSIQGKISNIYCIYCKDWFIAASFIIYTMIIRYADYMENKEVISIKCWGSYEF
jgi:hypothetical protein